MSAKLLLILQFLSIPAFWIIAAAKKATINGFPQNNLSFFALRAGFFHNPLCNVFGKFAGFAFGIL